MVSSASKEIKCVFSSLLKTIILYIVIQVVPTTCIVSLFQTDDMYPIPNFNGQI